MMDATSLATGVPPDIALLTGPLLLGYLFNYGLYGILVVQIYVYYLSFPNDSMKIQLLVYGCFICDSLQTIMTTHNAWHFLASGWGNPDVLRDPGWSWIAVPLFSGIVSASVQLFFAWRIWMLGRSVILTGVIVSISLTQGACALVSGIKFAIISDVTKISTLFVPAAIWLGGSALVDVLITLSMVYFLARSSTGFAETDTVITKLIRTTVETGLCTSAAATIELILFLLYKTNNLHMIPAICLAKLYTNTLLATLNSRSATFSNSSRTTGETGPRALSWRVATNNGKMSSASGIHVTTVQETVRDDDRNMAMVPLPPMQETCSTVGGEDSSSITKSPGDRSSFDDMRKVRDIEHGRH